jgi:transposase
LFSEFSLERHVPTDHLRRSIDRFVELGELMRELAPFYSAIGRPSIDPELMIRMLIIGYCFGIRSERRLCDEVHLNLACRWFCRLGLDGDVPDHSTFSKNRSIMRLAARTSACRIDRLRLRGPSGARDEFILAATAQNLRKLAKLIPMPKLNPA